MTTEWAFTIPPTKGDPALRVALDVEGSEAGADAIMRGAIKAARRYPHAQIICVGLPETGREYRSKMPDNMGWQDAANVVGMKDKPEAAHSMKHSSVRVTARLVGDGHAKAFVGFGNRGAQVISCGFHLKHIQGTRVALAALMPRFRGGHTILLDVGNNPEPPAEELYRFAIMGVAFARTYLGKRYPVVGVLSNGTETHKGTALIRAVCAMLRQLPIQGAQLFSEVCGPEPTLQAEPNDLANGRVDVMVADAVAGNKVIKTAKMTRDLVVARTLLALHTPWFPLALLALPFMLLLRSWLSGPETVAAVMLGLKKGMGFTGHGSTKAKSVPKVIALALQCLERCPGLPGYIDNLLSAHPLSQLDIVDEGRDAVAA